MPRGRSCFEIRSVLHTGLDNEVFHEEIGQFESNFAGWLMVV